LSAHFARVSCKPASVLGRQLHLPFSLICKDTLTMLSNTSSDFELIVRQQPERARVAGGKEKGTSALLFFELPERKR
jgi:hypothetical protein